MARDVFAVPIFFICFRECLECVIIISILFAMLRTSIGGQVQDRRTYRRLCRQVWWGVGSGLALCLIIGGAMIGAFYAYGEDIYGSAEDIWEGTFSLIATVIISLMGAALLRVSKLQDKWRVKLANALEKQKLRSQKGSVGSRFKLWCEKYAMFLLPFVTVLREGLEAVVFIGGVGLSLPASSFPLAVVCGLGAGVAVGYLIYRGGLSSKLQVFLIISTCILYLVAAGLFSKAVWAFEQHAWNKITGSDAAALGSGPGSYNVKSSVWHVNCCNAEINGGGGWGIFNAILGWENSATIGSVLSYNIYWLAVIVVFASMRYYEKRGHWPLMKARAKDVDSSNGDASSTDIESGDPLDEKKYGEISTSNVREIIE